MCRSRAPTAPPMCAVRKIFFEAVAKPYRRCRGSRSPGPASSGPLCPPERAADAVDKLPLDAVASPIAAVPVYSDG
ncbi:hypothetical protein CDD83_5539 [Cordyceps sp. RAO-2017]|nr:hypothetical protein CDD83_5539 [Cordyceps sp. RAO-2017]